MVTFTPETHLLIDGAWTNITTDTRAAEGISITRGRSDEASAAEAASCRVTIDNRDGKYSPRNPVGEYYGRIGRNTQMRVLGDGVEDNYLNLPGGLTSGVGGYSSWATTPDHSSLDITGDIDIRIEVDPETWRPTVTYGLMQKYAVLAVDTYSWSWALALTSGGYLSFMWTPDWSTGGSAKTVVSTETIDSDSPRLALRVTLDVNNGASGNDVKFYTDTNINGSYTQLGSTVTTAGVTSVGLSDSAVEIGRSDVHGGTTAGPDLLLQGRVYRAQVRNGIGGSLVAAPDFTLQDSGMTAFTDAQGRDWSLQGNAVMANSKARFHGEVSSWPQRWDKSESDVNVPVEAYGIMRRLGQGQAPLRSVMYRWLTSMSDVKAYWPCEDGDEATEFGSALPSHPPMIPGGEVTSGQYEGFRASEPLPEASGKYWTARVPRYTPTGETQFRFLMRIPSGGAPSTTTICRVRVTGTATEWWLDVNTSGELRLRAFRQVGDNLSNILTTSFFSHAVNGKACLVSLELTEVSGNVQWRIRTVEVGAYTQLTSTGTLTSRTVGYVGRVDMNTGDSVLTDTVFGHISVQNSISPFGFTTQDHDRLAAYSWEAASTRVLRLCREEDVPVTVVGDSQGATLLGPQLPNTLLDLLREAEASDMGILFEAREFLGLAYRTRASMYAQDATLTLAYGDRTVFGIEPVEDDDAIRNDITVTRTNGGSARAEQTTGPLSVSPPPAGVGRYDDAVEVSLRRDADLPDQASWRLHVGTVDEARFPVLGVNLASSAFRGDAGLTADALAADAGDRLVVTGLPSWMPPDDVQQIVQGMTEEITQDEWNIGFNCAPASPYDVAVWDDPAASGGEDHYSSLGTYLTADVPSSGSALVLDGVSPGRASTPDAAAFDITGDIDLRAHVAMDDWSPASSQTLVSKWTTSGNQRSYLFFVSTAGALSLQWTTGGVTTITATSTANLAATANGAARWVRVTLDVDNGAGGRTATFYTSVDGDTWTQLGSTVTVAGVTSIHSGTAPVIVGSSDVGTSNRLTGKVSAVEIRNGIAGTRVARPEFGAQPAGTTSFVDPQGNTWTITSPATVESVANSVFPSALFVSTPAGESWVGTALPFDLMADGERMTFTALTGTGAAQVFTVTRGVNGIFKGHATGAEVSLYKPAVAAL